MKYDVVLLDPYGNQMKPIEIEAFDKTARYEAERLAEKHTAAIPKRNVFVGSYIVYSVKNPDRKEDAKSGDVSQWPDWKKRAALSNYELGKED